MGKYTPGDVVVIEHVFGFRKLRTIAVVQRKLDDKYEVLAFVPTDRGYHEQNLVREEVPETEVMDVLAQIYLIRNDTIHVKEAWVTKNSKIHKNRRATSRFTTRISRISRPIPSTFAYRPLQ